MAEYVAKRLLLAGFTLCVILLVSYCLLRLAPGDPARTSVLGGGAETSGLNSEEGAFAENRSMREKLHLDKPVLIGFGHWFKAAVCHGDLGSSAVIDPGKPVTELILERLPATLSLNIWSIIFTTLMAVIIGVYSAVHADSWFDRSSAIVLFLLYSMPVMWVGLLLQTLFCEGGLWPFFPLKGLKPSNPLYLNSWQLWYETARCYALPVLCLSYAGLAGLSRYARSGMLDVLHSDYIRSARAKGLPEYRIIWEHGFRTALITLITLAGGLLPSLISGSVLVEYVFNIPGMGALSLSALTSRDYPLVMALFAFGGALTLLGILISDLLYLWADPRISLTGKR